ncbi:MAG: tRNA uridine(34) 5-carboxymethylaminomethyl modification radical SAM/GNAT enzyme Elp3 [Candidatus Woesearchaeota archaeon]|nr:tRNA uridine(34) 5-carboxymethylaminomethyl modification radical SAM/GNAT enzyme Elp3 [Candidatus Woesearchaeota archaeon]
MEPALVVEQKTRAFGQLFSELIEAIKQQKPDMKALERLKKDAAKKYGMTKSPSMIEILLHAQQSDLAELKKYLQKKPMRSLSGVAPIAVMTKPYYCPHGKCTMCPGGPKSVFGDVPQSYTGREPSTMRAIRAEYDAYEIVFNRLEQYLVTGHEPEKAEVIIQGGTFPAMDVPYQHEVVTNIFRAMNDFSDLFFPKGVFDFEGFKDFFELPNPVGDPDRNRHIKEKISALKKTATTLEHEQEKNETAHIRCVGLTIETKPDWGFASHGNEMLALGCTRIELGVQSVYDDVLKRVNRGHTLADTKQSIRELKDLGFKLNFHYMLGLPRGDGTTTTAEDELKGLKELFENPEYRPDMLKIYPCLVLPGTALYLQWKAGKYAPVSTGEAAEIISEFKRSVPKYCRIMRVQRDIPSTRVEAGVDKTNLRQYVEVLCKKKDIHCRCIRCREAGRAGVIVSEADVGFEIIEYDATGGKEFFISSIATAHDLLIGFVRLRFPGHFLRPEITPASALIREIHVFGKVTSMGSKGDVQHVGIGKQLMHRAEEIAKQHGKDKIVVISAIGTREYFKKLGYTKEGPYVVKTI